MSEENFITLVNTAEILLIPTSLLVLSPGGSHAQNSYIVLERKPQSMF